LGRSRIHDAGARCGNGEGRHRVDEDKVGVAKMVRWIVDPSRRLRLLVLTSAASVLGGVLIASARTDELTESGPPHLVQTEVFGHFAPLGVRG
jgi:hypothetical protein